MFKFLKGVVGSAAGGIKDLPYNIGEPFSASWGSWAHFRGTSKEDNSPVSIFSFTATSLQDGRLPAARNGVKRLRTLRHPNVLSFLHSTEVESVDGSGTKLTIYVVTEPVMPLAEKLRELDLKGMQRDEYYAWGLHQVSKAVSFLNNDCKMVHGNICLASVVVTPSLDWKLHAFDVLSEFDASNTDPSAPILPYEWLVGSQYKAMELSKTDWASIRKSPPWALDAWGIGCLIYELFSNTGLTKSEELRNTSIIPKNLLPDYQRLLGSTPARRLNPSKFIENSEFFQNKLVETIQFMDVLTLKDSMEKDSFFRKLANLVEQLPRQIVIKKILPMLGSALEFGSASSTALAPFLKVGSWLSQEELASKVLPIIVKLFSSTDRAIRVSLLQNIEQYGSALSNQKADEVFVHVATGFADTSALLRELTLKSMLIFAPKLSQRTISGSLLKYLSKLQVDEEPAIRTNTTILLGNIANLLNEGTRKKVLINAFTVRALRDGFAPARGAGIMALTATSQYYDVTEIATRVLPSLVMLTIDPDSDVRTKAFQATESFLQLIKQHQSASKLDDATMQANDSFLPTSTSALLGWAVSSLTATKGKAPEQSEQATGMEPARPISSIPSEVPSIEDAVTSEDMADKDGWDDPFDLESLSTIQQAQRRPLAAQPAPAAAPATSYANGPSYAAAAPLFDDEPKHNEASSKSKKDEEDDPWAEIEVPTPVTKAKPLSSHAMGGTRVRQAQHVSLGAVRLPGRGSRGRGRGAAAK